MDVAGFLWKYLAGPIVADALNSKTAVWNGVAAHTGYNPVNTVTWGLIAGLVIYTTYIGFQKYGVRFDKETVLFSTPFVLLGGHLRFIEDTGAAPFYLRLFLITPIVYLVIAALYLVSITFAEKYGENRDLFLSLIGFSLLVPPLAFTLYYLSNLVANPGMLLAIPLAGALTVPVYGLIRDTDIGHPAYYLAAFSQFFGGSVSMLSLPLGYTQKQLLAQNATQFFGAPGILLVKAGLLAVAFYILEDVEEKETEALLLLALIIIGLGTGLRVLLRALTGL